MMTKFEQGFFDRYYEKKVMVVYMRNALKKESVDYTDMTVQNVMIIRDYLLTKVSPNSAKTYLQALKAYLNVLKEDEIIPDKNYSKHMKVKSQPMQNVAFTEEEIARIENYYSDLLGKVGHYAEKDVLCLFLIECYCGARGCDVEDLTLDNISDGKLSYVSKKTKTLTILPAHHRLYELLEQKPKCTYPQSTKDRVIKRVAEKCGIDEQTTIFYRGKMRTLPKYEFVGFHCARRSFASNLATRNVPITTISHFMGHNGNVKMTQRYIKVDTNAVDANTMAFFV